MTKQLQDYIYNELEHVVETTRKELDRMIVQHVNKESRNQMFEQYVRELLMLEEFKEQMEDFNCL